MEQVVLVNAKDEELGLMEKLKAHKNEGELHRAFAAFVIDEKGRILLSKRSKFKPLWPLYWENTCSSHPRKGESYVEAGQRRLAEELGFTTPLRYLFKFTYQAHYNSDLSEHEVCAVLMGRYSGDISPNPDEIADLQRMQFNELKQAIEQKGLVLAPWLSFAVDKITDSIHWLKLLNGHGGGAQDILSI